MHRIGGIGISDEPYPSSIDLSPARAGRPIARRDDLEMPESVSLGMQSAIKSNPMRNDRTR